MRQEVYFNNIRKQIIQNLRLCEFELKIAVAWFTDKQILRVVNELISDGVDVEIIIYDDKINQKELFEDLYYSNAKIRLSKKMMHNKFCIIDDKILINGSYNWTNNASRNEENIQVSYDNYDLILQFKKQFEQLKILCSPIDIFFENSEIDYEFKDYYNNWPNYNFPYFIDTNNLKPSEINSSIDFGNAIFFITNREIERKFLFIQFLFNSKYSIKQTFKNRKEFIKYPDKFDFVHDLRLDRNNVAEFKLTSYLVEKKQSVYQIDSSGNIISEICSFSYKLNNDLFIHINSRKYSDSKPYFFDKNFKKTPIPYYVHNVQNNLIIVGKGENYDRSKIGVLNSKNELVIPFLYDDYSPVYQSDSESKLELVEFPIFRHDSSRSHLLEITNYSKSAFNLNNGYGNADHIIHVFSTRTLKLVEKKLIKGKKTFETDEFVFLSEENYKYKTLYEKIREYRFDKYPYLHQSEFFKVKEFDILKENYNNPSVIERYLNQFKYKRNEESRIREAEAKKREGCYVATMVYGSYEHPNVILLRKFRDQKLNTNYLGKIFIKVYYRYSPQYVQFVKDKRIIRSFSEKIVKGIVKTLKKCGITNA